MIFHWLTKNKSEKTPTEDEVQRNGNCSTERTTEPETENVPSPDMGAYRPTPETNRLKSGLARTRKGFADLFLGRKSLDQDLLDELETRLLTADVGIEVTNRIIEHVTTQIDRRALANRSAVQKVLAEYLTQLLEPYQRPLVTDTKKPFVLLMIGINGAGKTTTIGKLACHFKSQGKKVMLAAGDTFRAGAVEQLQSWGTRNHVPIIAQKTGADPASVAYDALQSAQAHGFDILIIDTAGRLHTQDHLMEELKKTKRVLRKIDPDVPDETMLVIDASNGQNALRQARQFHETMALDGVSITKLDGTAKGGIIFAVTTELQLPIRYIGVGEKIDDLRAFSAKSFVKALLYDD